MTETKPNDQTPANSESESETETETNPITSPAKARATFREPWDDVPSFSPARTSPERLDRALEHAKVCARIAGDNRGKDVLLLDLRQSTPLVDYFVIASASSRRQAYAIADEIDQEMKKRSDRKLGMEGAEDGRWILIDYGDFVVHVFADDARVYYALEEVWGDAPRLDWQDPDRPARPSNSQ